MGVILNHTILQSLVFKSNDKGKTNSTFVWLELLARVIQGSPGTHGRFKEFCQKWLSVKLWWFNEGSNSATYALRYLSSCFLDC